MKNHQIKTFTHPLILAFFPFFCPFLPQQGMWGSGFRHTNELPYFSIAQPQQLCATPSDPEGQVKHSCSMLFRECSQYPQSTATTWPTPGNLLRCLCPYLELAAGQQTYPSPNRSCSAAWETVKTAPVSTSADTKSIKPFSLSPKVASSRSQGKNSWTRQALLWVKLFYMLSKALLMCFLRTLQAGGGIVILSMFFSSIVFTDLTIPLLQEDRNKRFSVD